MEVEVNGVETMTFPTEVGTLFASGQKKNHSAFPEWLSKLVEVNGVEPMTSCLQGRRSSQLSYTPIYLPAKSSTMESERIPIKIRLTPPRWNYRNRSRPGQS